MSPNPRRRSLLLAGLCTTALLPFAGALAKPGRSTIAEQALRALETRYGGRLGVVVLDTASGARVGHRAEERFPLCSTFKALAAAQVLARVDRGEERLDRRVVFSQEDLVTYSPVTEKKLGPPGMSMAELCHAAVTVSDNAAGNLLLQSFGGPAALTAFVRGLGDAVTRLDRWEPELNEAVPGDPRDTTSPGAMADSLRTLLVGDGLSAASRAQLAQWLIATTTGGQRLRAGLPADWRVGDKTGTGANGVANDVAIAWPPGRAPVLITAYYTGSPATPEERNAVHAEVGRIAARWVAT